MTKPVGIISIIILIVMVVFLTTNFTFIIIDYEIFQYVNITQNFVCVKKKPAFGRELLGDYSINFKQPYSNPMSMCKQNVYGNCETISYDEYLSLKKRQENYYINVICYTLFFASCMFSLICMTINCLLYSNEKRTVTIHKIIVNISMLTTMILFIIVLIVDFTLCDLKNLYLDPPLYDGCSIFCSSYTGECNNPTNSGNITFILTIVTTIMYVLYYLIYLITPVS